MDRTHRDGLRLIVTHKSDPRQPADMRWCCSALPWSSYAASRRPLPTLGFNFISLLKCIWVKSSYLKSLPNTSPYELSRDWANKGVSQRVINWNNNNRFKSKNCAIYRATKGQLYIWHWRRNSSLPQCPIFHLEIKVKALLVRQNLSRRQHLVVTTQHWPGRPASLGPRGSMSGTTEHVAARNKECRRIRGGSSAEMVQTLMWICEGFHPFGILPSIQFIALYKIPMCQYSKSLWVKTCWDIGNLKQSTGGSGNVEEFHKGNGQLLCHLGGGRGSGGQHMCINFLNMAANQVVVGIYAS